ncbi:MAG: hypothetical protein L3J20_09345 [Flavobacteriaceae bacterium]|nr:hypothetical protein [Flavobacteriaceae bacterium]
MKKIFFSSLILLIFASCTEKKNPAEKEYKTATGKIIMIAETHPEGESLSTVTIKTLDFETNETFTLTDIDPLDSILVTDVNKDGFDELYIITKAAGSGNYLNIIAYASNNDKSLTSVYVPEISNKDIDKNGLFHGYMGQDSFKFEDGKIVRQFPVYNETDSNSNLTGATREISYFLKKGENGWKLEIKNPIHKQ